MHEHKAVDRNLCNKLRERGIVQTKLNLAENRRANNSTLPHEIIGNAGLRKIEKKDRKEFPLLKRLHQILCKYRDLRFFRDNKVNESAGGAETLQSP